MAKKSILYLWFEAVEGMTGQCEIQFDVVAEFAKGMIRGHQLLAFLLFQPGQDVRFFQRWLGISHFLDFWPVG